MLDYSYLKAFITVLCGLPFMLKGTCDIDNIFQKMKNSLSPPKNLIELQKEKFKEYLPSTQENLEIWSFVFSSKRKFSICNHEGSFFDREFKKNKNRQLNIFRIGKDKFFVEVLCFWANYQGNFEVVAKFNSFIDLLGNKNRYWTSLLFPSSVSLCHFCHI
jgi:hypothetical protein